MQTEKFQELESRGPGEPVDQRKPDKNLWTFLLLHRDDHLVSDHQHSAFSRFGMLSTE